jgi:hypothetical protein
MRRQLHLGRSILMLRRTPWLFVPRRMLHRHPSHQDSKHGSLRVRTAVAHHDILHPDHARRAKLWRRRHYVLLRLDVPRLRCYHAQYFVIPETRNRSYVELDEMFELKVPARKFATFETSIDRASKQGRPGAETA